MSRQRTLKGYRLDSSNEEHGIVAIDATALLHWLRDHSVSVAIDNWSGPWNVLLYCRTKDEIGEVLEEGRDENPVLIDALWAACKRVMVRNGEWVCPAHNGRGVKEVKP